MHARSNRFSASFVLWLTLLAANSCRDSTGPATSVFTLTVAITGNSIDFGRDYTVSVDSAAPVAVLPNTPRELHLATGNHVLRLAGIAPNCTLDGSPSRTVEVVAGAAAATIFQVACVANIGSISITTSTVGSFTPDQYYSLDFTDGAASIGANETKIISSVHAGPVELFLSNVPSNCTVIEGTFKQTLVAFNGTTAIMFSVFCARLDDAIAYVISQPTGEQIFSRSPTGKGAAVALTSVGDRNTDPAWSPDGQRIAFTSKRDGDDNIYVMQADGSEQVRLTSSSLHAHSPVWSPDGTRIAFVGEVNGADIYVMGSDGTDTKQLTHDGTSREPAWSPDGNEIVYSKNDHMYSPSTGLWEMNADGSSERQLTHNHNGDMEPAWSPDGTRIAFARMHFYTTDITVMKADGTQLASVAQSDDASHPAWSPDNVRVAFAVNSGNCRNLAHDYYVCDSFIRIARIDGGGQPLDFAPGSSPAWRPR